jgi:hypothetical protein
MPDRPEPRPAPRLPERPAVFDPEATERMETLVADLAEKLAEADRAQRRTLPLAWSAVIALALIVVCGLLAWIAYLYFTRGA